MLYTKEQVEHLMGLTKRFPSLTLEQLIEQTYSLELPEDDEINDAAFDEVSQEHIDAFKQGGEWVLGVIRSRVKRIANTYTDDNEVAELHVIEEQRCEEIKQEAERRVKLWIENTSFKEMTVSGSKLRFHMSIGAMGFPFEKEEWMGSEEFKAFITEEEFNSPQYDAIINELFDKYYDVKD